MTFQNPYINITCHQTTHIRRLQAFDTIMYYLGHHIHIAEMEESLIAPLNKHIAYKIYFNLVIDATNAINCKIKSSKVGTQ